MQYSDPGTTKMNFTRNEMHWEKGIGIRYWFYSWTKY